MILKESSAIDKSFQKAQELINTAIEAIDTLPESLEKSSLLALADFIISRDQ